MQRLSYCRQRKGRVIVYTLCQVKILNISFYVHSCTADALALTSKQTAHDLLSELHIFQKRSCFQKRITTFRKGTVFSLVPQGQTRAHSVRLVSAGWLELGDLVYSDLCLFKQRKRETERGGERERGREGGRERAILGQTWCLMFFLPTKSSYFGLTSRKFCRKEFVLNDMEQTICGYLDKAYDAKGMTNTNLSWRPRMHCRNRLPKRIKSIKG